MKNEPSVNWKEMGIKMLGVIIMAIIIHFVMTGCATTHAPCDCEQCQRIIAKHHGLSMREWYGDE
jgi:hypothetical protein